MIGRRRRGPAMDLVDEEVDDDDGEYRFMALFVSVLILRSSRSRCRRRGVAVSHPEMG
jgi:hypothetical protein